MASGLSDRRKGLLRLMEMARRGEITDVAVTYKDRLTTSFAGKLYGLRSHKKARELVSAVKAAVADAGDVPDENPG